MVSLSDIIFDDESRHPLWSLGQRSNSPKANFALGAASRLLSGDVTIETIEAAIIAGANEQLRHLGKTVRANSLKEVQTFVSGTAYTWFFEIKRVSQHNDVLRTLIKQDGNGLTALYRRIGPSQYQRPKGFGDKGAAAAGQISNLASELTNALSCSSHVELTQACQEIDAVYRALKAARKRMRSADT